MARIILSRVRFRCSLFVFVSTTRRERSERRVKIKFSLKLIDIHFILVLSLNITDFMVALEHLNRCCVHSKHVQIIPVVVFMIFTLNVVDFLRREAGAYHLSQCLSQVYN